MSSAYIASATPTNATETIASQVGVLGATTVTVTASGLTTGSVTVNSVTTQNAANLTLSDVTDSSPAFTEGVGNTATLTVGATDPNGNPVTLPTTGHSYYVFVTNSNGNPATNITVNGTTTIPSNGTGVSIGTASTFTLSDVSGNPDAGTYSVVVKDLAASGALNASPAFTVTENAGSASTYSLSAANNYISAANPSTTFTAQITDSNGNPIAKTGVPITFTAAGTPSTTAEASLGGGAMSTTPSYTAYTDASGKATVSFTAQAYDNQTWTVTSTVGSGYGISNPSPNTATTEVLYATTSALGVGLGNAISGTTVTGSVVAANSPIYGYVSENDQYGNAISGENDNVTITFSPSSGVALNGVPATLSESSTSNTVSLTGSVSDLNTYLASGSVVAQGAGALSASVKDNSVPTASSASSAVTVTAGSASQVTAVNASGGTTGQDVSSQSIVGPYTLEVQDAAGNVVNSTGVVTLNLTQLQSIFGTNVVGVRTSADGTESTSIQLPAGQGTEVVYLDTTGNIGTDSALDLGSVAYSAATVPSAPAVSVAAGASGTKTVTASWSPVTGATSYNVEYSTDGGSTWSTLANQTATTYTYTATSGGQSVEFRVSAQNAAGTSAWSTTASGTSPAAVAATITPGTPSSATETAGTNVTITYTVKDQYGNALSGLTPTAAISATGTDGGTDTTADTTSDAGAAAVSAGASAGQYVVTVTPGANADGDTDFTATVTFTAAAGVSDNSVTLTY